MWENREAQGGHRESWQKAGCGERQEEISSLNLDIQRRSLRSCTLRGLRGPLETQESTHKAGMQAPEGVGTLIWG